MVLGKRKKLGGKLKNSSEPFGKRGKRKGSFKTDERKPKWSNTRDDEELSSLSESSGSENEEDDTSKKEEKQEETALEKKMRLAKNYIEELKKLKEEDEDSDNERDFIGQKLKEDLLDQAGKLQRRVADKCKPPETEAIRKIKGFRKSLVCTVLSEDGKFLFAASKDCAITKWCMKTGKKLATVKGGKKFGHSHTDHVLCLALSSDCKYLASGGKDNLVLIWYPEKLTRAHLFKGHRGPVTGLAFRRNSHQLFSASADRTAKVWDLEVMGYVETLFGHQDGVQSCDSFNKERCITAGGRDGSVRIWKIPEESQLVYHGHNGSIDCARFINEKHFISGADDGTVSIWSIMRKKPICIIRNAHNDKKESANIHWITSVAALSNSDLVATGSNNGFVRLWKCSDKFNKVTELFNIPVFGFVNDLRFTENGSHLVAAVGKEHKLGRWWTMKDAKNQILIIPLQIT